MTLELAAIATIMLTVIGVAISLAAVIVPGQRAMRQEIGDVRQEMGEMRRDIGDLRERMARIEGLFKGFTRSGPATSAAPSAQPQP